MNLEEARRQTIAVRRITRLRIAATKIDRLRVQVLDVTMETKDYAAREFVAKAADFLRRAQEELEQTATHEAHNLQELQEVARVNAMRDRGEL